VPPPPSKPALAPLLPETQAHLDHPTGHFRPPGRPSATPQADAPFAHRECFAQPGPLLDPPAPVPRSPAPVPVPGSRYAVPGTGDGSSLPAPVPGTRHRYLAPVPRARDRVPRTGSWHRFQVPGYGQLRADIAALDRSFPIAKPRRPTV
jgi:hypothetical protein